MSDLIFNDNFSKKILNSLAEGVYLIDKEFKIIFVNDSAAKITGIAPTEVIGKLCRSFCKSDRCEIGCPITEVLRTERSIYDLETTISDYKGIPIPIKLNASIFKDENENPVGGIISFRKINAVNFDEYVRNQNYFFGIVGKSKLMQDLFKEIQQISKSNANVFITGETGVGKELVATAIKENSLRKDRSFVKVNCAALPENLLASELFGHIKGAFTDAIKDRIGRFELADNGIIYLDEITEIPLTMQAQLLRITQFGSFERLGESKERKVDVRIIASSNKNVFEEVKAGRFREDLYYRLNVIPIHIPPLRKRKEDIPLLVDFFIKKFSNIYNKKINSTDSETINLLYNYDWPGNVRELENVIEYAFIRSKRNDYLCNCSLPPYIRNKKKM